MQALKTYFENISSLQRSLLLAGGIFVFYLLEYLIPFIRLNYRKVSHAGVNIFFTATTAVVNFALSFLIVWACQYAVTHKSGLLYLVHLPTWAFILAGLLVMDLIGAWFVHFLQHKIKWMWRFHLVHHCDTKVDVTTANRHHPGESVLRFVFTLLSVIILGAPIWLVMLYQSLSVLLSQFNHANINISERADHILSYILVSPNMHKVHHHYVQPYTDSNYANIFSMWDRLFGTYLRLPRQEIIYGIDTHMLPQENRQLGNLMSIPFQPYRAPEGSKFSDEESS
ncbi:MAG: sterol desaturase family protein [Ferruginibacter sp.]